jgi:Flp pilus assembly protein TadD
VSEGQTASPKGTVYDWYTRGMQLLQDRNPAAAAALLEHAVRAEPTSRSAREALARAQFDSGRYAAARDTFATIVADNPTDDYALFGLGLACNKLGDFEDAAEHLALAVAMRPENKHYATALRHARAARDRE